MFVYNTAYMIFVIHSKMIILSVILLIITSVICFIHWFQNYSSTAKLLNAFPQPWKMMPIIGHISRFSLKQDVLYQQFRKLTGQFNETFSLWAFIIPSVEIVTADDAEIILSSAKYIDKSYAYNTLRQWLQTGLLTSTGQQWHRRRKMLTPAFHYNILQMFVEIFGEQCENLKTILEEECNKPKTNVTPIITMATLSTICETSMGVKLDKNDASLLEYHSNIYKMAEIVIERTLSPWLYIDFLYYLFPISRREKKIVKQLHKFTSDLIKAREEVFNIDDVIDLESTTKKPTKRLAMLDLLLYEKHLGNIDDAGIQEEVNTFVFEGHDTTSAGITFALLLIANHSHVQDKIAAELEEIFGDSDRQATYEDLQNMKYLECCLKECLRLYPSVPQISRHVIENIKLTKYTCPAGTDVWVHIYNIHRDPKYYPDPEKFDPDRFLIENSKGRNPYAYVPFSAGPRNCIGQKFAMLELKSMMSTIIRNFILEPVDTPKDLTWIMDIVLRVRGPVNIKFKHRYEK